MLDHAKLMHELQKVSGTLFFDMSTETSIAQKAWQEIISDPLFQYKIKEASCPWPLPEWTGAIDQKIAYQHKIDQYHVVAVDGSQIYPDKHQGTNCSLINIGTVQLVYAQEESSVSLRNQPYLFKDDDGGGMPVSPEWINGTRQEYEFEAGWQIMDQAAFGPAVFLFDGSLIFWHLDAKDIELKHYFLSRYLSSLNKFYESKKLLAGYISLPKSKELVHLLRLQLSNFDVEHNDAYTQIDHIVDANVVSFFLEKNERTNIFKSNSAITSHYPDHLKPYFYYLDVGTEIARIEVPQWIAKDEQAVELVTRIILDQCHKGGGYPVCLAESHEQAVVKGPDREFFYSLISKIGFEQQRTLRPSAKSMKKRGIGV